MPRSYAKLTEDDITAHAISDFKYVFNLFDLNKDGNIHLNEFGQIIELLGDQRPNDKELRNIIQEATTDIPDGQPVPDYLNFQHFLNFFAVYDTYQDISDDDIFDVLDTEHTGIISSRELAKTLHAFGVNLTQDEVDAMADFASARHNTTHFSKAEFQDLSLRLSTYRRSLCQQKTLDESADESED